MKNLEYIIDVCDDLPDKIFCDEKRIKQVLFNLVGNALKFTQSGHIKMKVTCEKRARYVQEAFGTIVQNLNN